MVTPSEAPEIYVNADGVGPIEQSWVLDICILSLLSRQFWNTAKSWTKHPGWTGEGVVHSNSAVAFIVASGNVRGVGQRLWKGRESLDGLLQAQASRSAQESHQSQDVGRMTCTDAAPPWNHEEICWQREGQGMKGTVVGDPAAPNSSSGSVMNSPVTLALVNAILALSIIWKVGWIQVRRLNLWAGSHLCEWPDRKYVRLHGPYGFWCS